MSASSTANFARARRSASWAPAELYQITDLGKLMPRPKQVEKIGTGEVGFLVAAIKDLHDVRIGDTVTDARDSRPRAAARLSSPIQQMVFCDFYPGGKTQYEELRDAMDRLQLNDSSFTFPPESPTPWASASAADSSACSTWRSSRNGSSANSTSKSCRPPRRSPTKSR